MYENIKTNFQANEILAGQVRMWQEGKTLEAFIFESKIEGKLEGKLEGEQIGLYKGKLEGEHQKARETAKILKAKSMNLDFIQDVTGLSIDEIEKL